MTASRPRIARRIAVLGACAALVACAVPFSHRSDSREDLLREFQEGRARLDCGRCRFDFRGAEWLLRDGHQQELAVAILRTGDGSGRSWYLLGRAAELDGKPETALHYYRESLATPRNPVVALWPLYEDVNYRIRALVEGAPVAPAVAEEKRDPAGPVEIVTVDSLVVRTRPGQIGAFLLSLNRGDRVVVLDRSADWEQVRVPDGRTGWVYGRYTASQTARAPVRRDVVASAKPAPRPAPKKAAPAKTRVAAKPPAPVAAPAKPEPVRIALTPAAALGILGCPLPEGAMLAGESHGVDGPDDHPTQTFQIPASAPSLAGFFEAQMEKSGWRKSYASSEYLLYFVKEERTLGVLIDREGGTFTLMGS